MKKIIVTTCLFCEEAEKPLGRLSSAIYYVKVAGIDFSFRICEPHERKRVTDIRAALFEKIQERGKK